MTVLNDPLKTLFFVGISCCLMVACHATSLQAQEDAAPSAEAAVAEAEVAAEAAEVEEEAVVSATDELAFAIDNVTLFICAVLVLFMQVKLKNPCSVF